MKKLKHIKLFENLDESVYSEIQKMIDENQYITDKDVTEEKLISSDKWIIYISKDTLAHIKSHMVPSKELGDAPGSYYSSNWKEGVKNAISKNVPQVGDKPPFRTAWTGVDAGIDVGFVSIGFDDSLKSGDLGEGYKSYTYERPVRGEKVKETIIVKSDQAEKTNFVTVVGSKIGEVDGKGLVSLWTAYPDYKDGKLGGKDIPMNRNEFQKNGFYFKCSKEFFDAVSDKTEVKESKRFKHLKRFESFGHLVDLKDTYKTIKEQYGVDPKEGLTPNSFQQVLIVESELGEISSDTLNKSIKDLESKISEEKDTKVQKELSKKLENLKKVTERPKKEISMDLENKWSKNFGKVDELIESLDERAKKQLLTNVFINENPKWHPERNSLVHIKIVSSRGIDTKDEDLMKSALYHDIAKFDTATFNAQGWPTCLGHDKLGSESAKASGMNDTVVYVCANHMKIKGWQGDSEGGTLNPSTKFQIFSEAPGSTSDEKANSFYKLCIFSKMDNMAYDFNAEKLKWENPTYEKWNEECPLKDEFKKEELVEIKVEKAKPTFTSQDLMKFGAKGPQIGEINKAIMGKTKEESFEIIKQILGNPELKMESKKWIMTFESFKKNK